jgi:hypothetical protein
MLARSGVIPSGDYAFELKWVGFRAQAGGEAAAGFKRWRSIAGIDSRSSFPQGRRICMRALIAFGTTAVAALAVAVTSASGINRPQTFSLLEIDQSDQSTNIGFDFQRLPRPGDRFAFKSSLYNWAGKMRGARIGHDEGICTFIRVAGNERNPSIDAHCAAGIFLPAGELLVEGIVHFREGPSRFEVPIVGGTGAYANARGFIRIRDLGTGDSGHSNMEFHLLP